MPTCAVTCEIDFFSGLDLTCVLGRFWLPINCYKAIQYLFGHECMVFNWTALILATIWRFSAVKGLDGAMCTPLDLPTYLSIVYCPSGIITWLGIHRLCNIPYPWYLLHPQETESNSELRSKLQKLEKQLHDAQAKQQAKHTISVKSAYIWLYHMHFNYSTVAAVNSRGLAHTQTQCVSF